MAFGFFKKTITADTIFHNGHIFTQDPELPWADAVAVKDEAIFGVGNFSEMDAITGKDTCLIDLEGKFMFPGFIDAHRSPVLKVFQDQYLDLTDCHTTDDVLSAVSAWAEEHEDAEVLFGYGYRDDLKPESAPQEAADIDEVNETDGAKETAAELSASSCAEVCPETTEISKKAPLAEETSRADAPDLLDFPVSSKLLSEACDDRPVLLLCQNGVQCWTNMEADRIVAQTAEEEVVETVTVSYVLNLLIPFDFEEIEELVKFESEALAEHGFTSVLDIAAPDYFETLYEDSILGLYNEGELRQRFFGSYLVNRPLQPRMIVHKLMARRTNCLEIGDRINAEMLYLYLENAQNPIPFTQGALNAITEEVSDKGFGLFIEADGSEDLTMAYLALENLRSKGYKNNVIIAADAVPDENVLQELLYRDTAILTYGTVPLAPSALPPGIGSVTEAIEQLTTGAAAIIGMSEKLGKIAAGYLADFTLFETNPLDGSLQQFAKQQTCMTVVGGSIVYDAQSEADMDLYRIMSTQQL